MIKDIMTKLTNELMTNIPITASAEERMELVDLLNDLRTYLTSHTFDSFEACKNEAIAYLAEYL